LIIFDNHLHLRRDGRYLEAVKEFINAGGTHFILAQYPMPDLVIKEKRYLPCYHHTLDMAREIQQALPVKVYTTIGPYPVDYLKLTNQFGRDQAIAIMKKGMDEAAHLIQDHQAIGIGEIGRPHFPVDDHILSDSNDIMVYGMQRAKDVGCPVILHTESTTPSQCKELMKLGKTVGLSAEKIVKHFAPPLITPEENYGLMPSVLSSRKNIINALEKGSRFLMETDYIDDPKRPGAVLGPKTVPKVTNSVLTNGLMTELQSEQIHKINPEKTYNISLEE